MKLSNKLNVIEMNLYVVENLKLLNMSEKEKDIIYMWVMNMMEDLNIIDRGI